MKTRSTGKIAVIVAIILVVIVAGGFFSLWMMFPPEKIKKMATMQVEELLGRPVKIGNANISIYPFLGFSLSNVEIDNTTRQGFSKEPFLKFSHFALKISLLSLIKQQPEISKIVIQNPSVHIEIDSSGNYNFSDLNIMKKDTASDKKDNGSAIPMLPVPVSLKQFTIENGQFLFFDARSGQRFCIDDIDDKILFSIDKELKNITTIGELSLAQVSIKTDALKKPLSNLVVTLHHDIGANLRAGTAEIKSVRLSFQKVFLNIAGTLSGLQTTPQVDVKLTSDAISLQDLLKEIPVELVPVLSKITAAGELRIGLEIKGLIEQNKPLPVKGTLSISNGKIQYSELPNAINQINLQCAFTDNSLNVNSLKLRFGDDPVALRAIVNDFKKPQIDCKLIADLNLDNVKGFAKLPPGASLGGKVHADFHAQGEADPADPKKMNVQGAVTCSNTAIMWPPLAKPAIVNGTVTISNQSIVNAFSISIGRSQTSIAASITNYLSMIFPDSTRSLPRPSAVFTIASPMLDVDEFLPVTQKQENTDSKEPVQQNSAPLIAPLPGVDVRGTVTAASVIYNKIPLQNVKISVSVINDIALVDIATGFAGGTVSEKLNADLRKPALATFANKLAINSVEINDVMKNFGGFMAPTTPINRELNNLPKSLLGKINLSSDLNAAGGTTDALLNSLSGNIALGMLNGTITNSLITNRISGIAEKFIQSGDIHFKDFSTNLKIVNKSIVIDNLKMVSDAGDWNAQGSVGFDAGLNLSINNRLTKNVSATILSVQNSGKNLAKGLLQGTQFASAANSLIESNGIPSDGDGRVTVILGLTGTAADPKASFIGFGKGSASATNRQQSSPKEQVIQKVTEKIDQAKIEAEKRIEEERARAEAELQKKAEEQKAAIIEKKDNVQEQLKKSAKDKFKKLF